MRNDLVKQNTADIFFFFFLHTHAVENEGGGILTDGWHKRNWDEDEN